MGWLINLFDAPIGYKVTGEVNVSVYITSGFVFMTPFEIRFNNLTGELSDELIQRIIRAKIESSDLNVESIDSADVKLYRLYKSGRKTLIKNMRVYGIGNPTGKKKELKSILKQHKKIDLKTIDRIV